MPSVSASREGVAAMSDLHTNRRGDKSNPHRGDCTGTRCPDCDCCMHCPREGDCCTGCTDSLCECREQGGE